MNYTVYKHTFPNNKVYIGITKLKPEHRWGKYGKNYLHKTNGKYNQPTMAYAILKYGWENIKHEIIYDGLSKEDAEKAEIELIDKYKSNDIRFGYNIENGGNSTGKLSEETKLKISNSERGEKHYRWGKHCSKETKMKIGNAIKGRKLSSETKNKISNSLIGIHRSNETKVKMSESKSGEKHPMYGKSRPEEVKAKVRKPVRCIETGKVYNSISCASIETGIGIYGISKVCTGKLKTSGGYHWEFV